MSDRQTSPCRPTSPGRFKEQWRSQEKADGADRHGRESGRRQKGDKNGDDEGASDISRLLGAAKLQSVPGGDNRRYATGEEAWMRRGSGREGMCLHRTVAVS